MANRRKFLKYLAAGLPVAPFSTLFNARFGTQPMPGKDSIPRRIAFVLFDGLTHLDFVGFYDPITRLRSMDYIPDLEWDICGWTETIRDNFGLEVRPDKVRNDLGAYDLVFVPGGLGTRQLQYDEAFIDWIKTATPVEYKVSVCTGSLLLGAAGFLQGKNATTNYNVYELLEPYCSQVIKERIVEDGNLITGGAVATSLDLGLYVCKKFVGPEAAATIRRKMGY